jgi:hypothetical protein
MKKIFVMINSTGPNRDFMKGPREQPWWEERAAFIVNASYLVCMVAPSMASTSLNACAAIGSRAERRRR